MDREDDRILEESIECPNKLGSFNQFEKGAVGFQINYILHESVFPRMKRLIPSFWALTANYRLSGTLARR